MKNPTLVMTAVERFSDYCYLAIVWYFSQAPLAVTVSGDLQWERRLTTTQQSARVRLIEALAARFGHNRRQNCVHKTLTAENDPIAGTVFETVANELRKMGVDPGDSLDGIGKILGISNVVQIGRGRFEESILGSEVAGNLRALVNGPTAIAA